ncbi:MAG: glycosyltransferase family 2 protein [Bacteroidales bacterium]|nr:glycosyltransferase family 2 protein [Bacteroidales bacterium]
MYNNIPLLAIAIPCYNEGMVIETTADLVSSLLNKYIEEHIVDINSFICFIDDGSKDETWEKIVKLNKLNSKLYKGIKLTRNFGHQAALLAGLHHLKDRCDCCISLDADLQDDINIIGEMIKKYTQGTDIVYGIRLSRDKDKLFKRFTARVFYKLMIKMGVELKFDHADYRLMSRLAMEYLYQYREVNLFLRGIVTQIGLKTDDVYYERKERIAGDTKYPLKKMISFAINGITSFSSIPLRFITIMGFIISIISIGIGCFIIISRLKGNVIQGWTSISLSIWFLGGLTLLSIGIIGEYIGKIYKEVKSRPVYLIEKIL